MIDYSKLSDFEINKLVAECVGLGMDNGCGFTDSDGNLVCYDVIIDLGGESRAVEVRVNYCKNPSDAWPIIVENNISINALSEPYDDECDSYFANGLWECCTVLTDNGEFFGGQDWIVAKDENPLRAAMIVYLMMQEDK